MKIKIALISFFLLFQNQVQSSEKYNFLNDCIEVFSIMNKSQIEFDSLVLNNQNPKKIKTIAENYNHKLIRCIGELSKFSNTNDNKIKKSIELFQYQIETLIEHNERYLNLIKSDNLPNEIKLLNKGQKFLLKIFDSMLLMPCSLTIEKPNGKKISMLTSYLTLKERNLLNKKLISSFGDMIKSNSQRKRMSSFEKSVQWTYQFLNNKLEFKIKYKN